MKKTGGQRIDTVFVLIIFCIFAISVLMVLMFGASIYQNLTGMIRDGQDERAVLSYIWTKAKNDDNEGRISVGYFHGLPTLFLDEEFDRVPYRTRIYYYDGWVHELFSETELDFYPVDGTRIIEVESLDFEELDHGLIRITAGTLSLLISPRSGATGDLPDTFNTEGAFFG